MRSPLDIAVVLWSKQAAFSCPLNLGNQFDRDPQFQQKMNAANANQGLYGHAGEAKCADISMVTPERYLQFDNIDMKTPDISSRCSQFGQEFRAEPKPSERIDDALLRIRADFEAHKCGERIH